MTKKLMLLLCGTVLLAATVACDKKSNEPELEKVNPITVYLPDDLEEIDLDYLKPATELNIEWVAEEGVTYKLIMSLSDDLSNPISVDLSPSGKDKITHEQLDTQMNALGIGKYKRVEFYWSIEGSKGDAKVRSGIRSMQLWRFLTPFTDPRDGEVYRVCKVMDPLTGNYAIWMADNMRCRKYADGTSLDLYNDVRFAEAPVGASEQEKEWVRLRGGLYTWPATVRDVAAATAGDKVQGIAPNGWHIATKQEWTDLINMQPNNESPGTSMKDPTYWPSNSADIGTNSSNFNMVSSGFVWEPVGSPNGIIDVNFTYFWMSTIPVAGDVIPWDPDPANFNAQGYSYGFTSNDPGAALFVYNRLRGFSVRCVLD